MRARLLYRLMRPIVRFALKVYFDKINIEGLHKLPKSGPVILACNHPATFLDAVLIACFCPRAVHFMTRGDLMKRRVFGWFFRATHQIPVYRRRDGFSSVKSNFDSFEHCKRLLADGRVVLLFVEGGSIYEKNLRPVQKGFARICYTTLQHGVDNIHIYPVGINYEDMLIADRDVLISVGSALEVSKSFLDEGEQAFVLRKLQDELSIRLSQVVFSLGDQVNNEEFYRVQEIKRWEGQGLYSSIARLKEYENADTQNYLEGNKVSTFGRIFPSLDMVDYFWLTSLAALHFLLGWVLIVVRDWTRRHISSLEFQVPIRISMSIVLFPVWMVFLSVILGFFFPLWVSVLLPLLASAMYLKMWKWRGRRYSFFYDGPKQILQMPNAEMVMK